MTTLDYPAGSLVTARGRDWLVLPGSPDGTLLVRPLRGVAKWLPGLCSLIGAAK